LEAFVSEWQFAHAEPEEQFALLHQFSMIKKQGDDEIEFIITVKEFVQPKDPAMKFFATTDKQTNQKSVPFTPCGWGTTLLKALSECMGAVRRFPYQG
jgi:hypothetical protein